ncbi:GNAT family N-acetyltransferase [Nocardia transvalensis]|uniref:GNAT family N-acetyltransferase n=1 Tax=Nocardia transvalensis TaxID=37333 RepID=UPI0018960D1C|nr:GNAT family N-acetyltransferase [Nocardia transvalensis]MBF6330559.1 GNAT family N-acetyltransferase [Nocardia transvalensis]
MTGALVVRTASVEDVGVLCSMIEDFNRGEGIAWARAAGEDALRALISDVELGVVGLLSESDSVVGYFVVTWGFDLEWNGRDAYLTELYLVSGVRGRGLGRVALGCVEETARRHGARALHLMVRPENVAAVRLYERAGYMAPPRTFLSKPL